MLLETVERWAVYADVLIQRAALTARLRRGEPPRPLAGLVVADDEIAGLLERLPGLSSPDPSAIDEIIGETEADVRASEEQLLDPDRRDSLSVIAWNAKLDDASSRILALVAAVDLDPARQKLVGYLNDDVTRGLLTPSTIAQILGNGAEAALAADAPLRRACLLTLDDDESWGRASLRLGPGVAAAFAGAPGRDPALPRRVEVVETDSVAGDDFVLVHGGDARSRAQAAVRAVTGERFLVTSLPATDEAWAAVVRQSVIGGFGVIVDLGRARELDSDVRWWVDRLDFLAFGLCSHHELTLASLPERPFVEIASISTVVDVGGGHLLDAEQARLVAKALPSVGDDAAAAVRRLVTGQLDHHAGRTRPGRGWEELVLAPGQLEVLHELVKRYRYRGRVYHDWGFPSRPSTGATALFSGPSGTGKTMTAEVIATDLGLDLYRIDLSAVVSKYIGETEKNLEEIFTASAAGNLVLFFDEADALFGKRSDVGDAHDRYANIEVAYLLQRLERYDGFVILATNLRNNIDAAFIRRIDVALDFAMPDAARRRMIWEQVFPSEAPVGDIDFELLSAEFEVSGGSIRNAAVHAAFLAAGDGDSIEMRHVALGMRREFQKMGRLQGSREFETLRSIDERLVDAASA